MSAKGRTASIVFGVAVTLIAALLIKVRVRELDGVVETAEA